jgi:predicted RND superfamily exporter protein
MQPAAPPRLLDLFRRVVAARWIVAALFAILLPVAILVARQVPSDTAIDALVVRDDPDARDHREFSAIFPEREQVILLFEAEDPFAPRVLERIAAIEARLGALPRIAPFSALTLYARARPGSAGAAADPAGFKAFALGTTLLRRQGLVGDDFLGMPLRLEVEDAAERDAALAAIDAALAPDLESPAPLRAVRRVGGPWLDAWIERETADASARAFPLFGLFVVAITLALFRSWRTLLAVLTTLGVSVAGTVGFGRLAGFSFTIVSSLVPLTVMVTCTAALVYLQSRFAEMPEGGDVAAHQVFSLANKFVATTASLFAAAVGFAALAVSKIRPIREMGLWVAAGLLITWVVVFTLFPALQSLLKTPTTRRRTTSGRRLLAFLEALPGWTFRWRWPLLAGSMALMLLGVAALLGVPGRLAPMALQTDALAYVDPDEPVARDTRRFERALGGLSVAELWVTTPPGAALDPALLRGLDRFMRGLEADDRLGSVTGPTTALRFMNYVAGAGDRLPDDDAAWAGMAARLEALLLEEPALRDDVDVATLSNARITVVHRGDAFADVAAMKRYFADRFAAAVAGDPGLAGCRLRVTGSGLLQAKIAQDLVPTLTESFVLTAAIIFVAFLVVFRSGAARLMAMIPSVFAILTMFVVMRLTGIPLNVATILIASTVLGASENDQIHFFFHYQEGRDGGAEAALRHALRVAGRAILFATLINAGGFMALALSGLPPMRQFGILAASAFTLSMLASLTALPAALWVISGARPDAR